VRVYFDACAEAGQGAAEAEAVAQVGCKCQRSSWEVMFALASHWHCLSPRKTEGLGFRV